MLVSRFNRAYPLSQLRSEVDHLLDDFVRNPGTPSRSFAGPSFPALNVWEDEGNLFAEAEVAGLCMDNLEIFVQGNELTLKGERKGDAQEGVSYHRRERGTGSFNRVLMLPVEVDAGKVEAGMQDGVLTITLPKAERAKPRKITVKSVS